MTHSPRGVGASRHAGATEACDGGSVELEVVAAIGRENLGGIAHEATSALDACDETAVGAATRCCAEVRAVDAGNLLSLSQLLDCR